MVVQVSTNQEERQKTARKGTFKARSKFRNQPELTPVRRRKGKLTSAGLSEPMETDEAARDRTLIDNIE